MSVSAPVPAKHDSWLDSCQPRTAGTGSASPRREAAPPPCREGLGASCGLDDICLSVCLAPGLRAAGLLATPLQALSQARLSSPAATGHCRWKWISTLINPWRVGSLLRLVFPGASSKHNLLAGFAVVWQRLVSSFFLPLAHSLPFYFSGLPHVLYLPLFLVFLCDQARWKGNEFLSWF